MPIEGDGLVDPDADDEEQQREQREERRTTYVLHPNCAIEEM